MKVLGLASAALLLCTAAIAQQTSPVPAAPSFYDFGEDKACLAWADGCRSCRRETDNTVSCSNIGIACQPAAAKCTARQEPAKLDGSSSTQSPK